jgi:hypothetical protein
VPQAAAGASRGGGESGSTERRKFRSLAGSIGDLLPAGATTTTGEGSTNATALTIERSESWQQDIEHAIIPGMSCPQSM